MTEVEYASLRERARVLLDEHGADPLQLAACLSFIAVVTVRHPMLPRPGLFCNEDGQCVDARWHITPSLLINTSFDATGEDSGGYVFDGVLGKITLSWEWDGSDFWPELDKVVHGSA